VIANCNYYTVALTLGGHYEFYHTTINNEPQWGSHSNESVVFNNYYTYNDTTHVFDFYALFANSIIWGEYKQEFGVDTAPTDQVKFEYLFDHCLMKLEKKYNISNKNRFKSIINSMDSLPRFKNPVRNNYRLDTLSPAKDKGLIDYSRYIQYDLDGNDRLTDGKPDLGAYERFEQ
jgi:hypothetical protein